MMERLTDGEKDFHAGRCLWRELEGAADAGGFEMERFQRRLRTVEHGCVRRLRRTRASLNEFDPAKRAGGAKTELMWSKHIRYHPGMRRPWQLLISVCDHEPISYQRNRFSTIIGTLTNMNDYDHPDLSRCCAAGSSAAALGATGALTTDLRFPPPAERSSGSPPCRCQIHPRRR
jgi:hypothetical protein